MNKMIKMAVIAVGAAATFAGCAKTPEKEYEDLIRATMKGAPAVAVEEAVNEGLAGFKKMTPAEQQEELQKTRKMFEELKDLKN